MREFKIAQLLQKRKFLWARKFLGSIRRDVLPGFKVRRARLTLRVLDVVLQDDERKNERRVIVISLAKKRPGHACRPWPNARSLAEVVVQVVF